MITALVVGGGSIGKRHLRNLLATGRSAAVVETREDRRAEITAKHPDVKVFTSLDQALAAGPFQAGFVCVPTAYHVPTALVLARRDQHIFMEKPVSHSPDGVPELVDLLEKRELVGMTAFCMRFFKPLQKAKELVDAGRIGRLVTARSFTGAYLPDWHPWEDYRSFYMAKKDQGGGVLLDECHAFDWMQWLCGPITGVCAVAGTFSDLEVETDDVCEVVARFGDRAVGSIHLDMVDRSIRTQVELIGTAGTVLVDLREHTVRAWDPGTRKWDTFTTERSYDQMYVDELAHFFDCIDRRAKPVVDLREGYQIQRVIDACARSSASGRWVTVA
jgi:predicted dehydrogenase